MAIRIFLKDMRPDCYVDIKDNLSGLAKISLGTPEILFCNQVSPPKFLDTSCGIHTWMLLEEISPGSHVLSSR